MVLASDANCKCIQDDVPYMAFNEVKTAKPAELGAVKAYNDGRVYVLAATDADITIGCGVRPTYNVQAIAASYFGADSSTAVISGEGLTAGDTTIRLTDDVTGVTLNEFAGGWLFITTATGKGGYARVKSNEASASAGVGFLVQLYAPGIPIALANDSVGELYGDVWADMALAKQANFAGNQDCHVVGAAAMTTTAATDSTTEYFFVQIAGIGMSLAGAAVATHGGILSAGEDVAGAMQTAVEADGEYNYQALGVAMEDMTDTEHSPVVWFPQVGLYGVGR